MILKHFNSLSDDKKEEYTKAQGTYLVTRPDDDLFVDLYSVDEFFVEIFYLPLKAKNKNGVEVYDAGLTTRVLGFDDEEHINIYIDSYMRIFDWE